MILKNDTALWNMTLLYPSTASHELESDFSSTATMTAQFRKKYFGNVAALNGKQLKSALVELECIQEALVKPQTYAYLLFAANSEDIETKKLSQRAMEFGNRMSREILFFDLEVISLAEDW